MKKPEVTIGNRDVDTCLAFLQSLMGEYHPRNFAVRLWDGTLWEAENGLPTRYMLVLKHPGALRQMFARSSELALGEAYIYDDFDLEGDFEAAFQLAAYLESRDWSLKEKARNARLFTKLPSGNNHHQDKAARLQGSRHSLKRDKQAITYHYDVSNDFYKLWLDNRMVYSCAYFQNLQQDLDGAQEAKLDYICRKLGLAAGHRLLDIGCGWGGLVMHAARHYDVEAVGITLSKQQAALAKQRIREAGLEKQCRVEVLDYRQAGATESFDRLVSVGMFEHVGKAKLPEYFTRAWQMLRPGGVFLNHGIASNATDKTNNKSAFSEHYVFPDGELVPLGTTLQIAEQTGFEVRDVESLREHYALTLRHWVKRIEAQHDAVQATADEITYRVWRLFMSGSAFKFRTGKLNVYQTLLCKPLAGRSGMPLTRNGLYK